jgi:hypothetical protein
MRSKSIGVRIPDAINERFESYGRRHFPKGDSFDKTKTALDLIENLGLKPRRSTTALLLNMSIVYEIYAKM